MTWLEICGENDDCSGCCPYGDEGETFNCRSKLMADALNLLKEQDELLHKKQKDIDRLCNEISGWKHKFHDNLLKEQEAVKPVIDEQTGRIWLCGKCGSYVGFEDNDPHDPNEFDKFCRNCGRPVLWEVR